MTTYTIGDLLKYANLQMAAEAIGLASGLPDSDLASALVAGNFRVSKFPSILADDFASKYEVVQHRSNTGTGFSGTLFREKATGQLILSFRSTEFIDDAVRDNQATNKMELTKYGWAFGQISDMEAWYRELNQAGGPLEGKQFSVTGYSLGGHLATAFNLLRDEQGQGSRILGTYTFNAAGVGTIDMNVAPTLSYLIQQFDIQRKNADGQQILFSDPASNTVYQELRAKLTGGVVPTENDIEKAKLLVTNAVESQMLVEAMARIREVMSEVARVARITNSGPAPAFVPASLVDATKLDYQMAVLLAQRGTHAGPIKYNAVADERPLGPYLLPNFYDIYGAPYPSAVANSQYHYGVGVPIFIEDQPLYRGTVPLGAALQTALYLDVKLLVDDFSRNDFGDTHSLVLLVDSLSVMNVFATLDAGITPEKVQSLLAASTNSRRQENLATQGKTDGDTLEITLDALRKLIQGSDENFVKTEADLNGNTWWDPALRNAFHANLNALHETIKARNLTGKLTIDATKSRSSVELFEAAKSTGGLAYRYSLKELNPFVVTGDDSIYVQHNTNGELELYDPTGKTPFGMTLEYLADRAAFLGWANNANTADLRKLITTAVPESWQFTDLSRNYSLEVIKEGLGTPSTAPVRYAIFGGDGADALQGQSQSDRLYGGAGTDYLEGKAGNDYLEGGAGLDLYNYRASTTGVFLESNDGNDTIRDTDGRGVLRYTYSDSFGRTRSAVIAEATVNLSATKWQSADGKFTYTKTPNDKGRTDLIITINGDVGGSLTLKDFKDGDYGIYLWKDRTTPLTTKTITGDKKPQDMDPADGIQTERDELGNYKVTDEADPDRPDILYGNRPLVADPANPSPPGEKIDAGGGNDSIYADRPRGEPDNGVGNSDWVIGGAGRDLIVAGAGDDLVEAGADGVWTGTVNGKTITDVGGDIVNGGQGNDEIYGDTKISLALAIANGNTQGASGVKGDWLSGGEGDDIVVGGNGNDVLTGGGGKDILIAGAGDDDILGDSDWTAVMFNWTVTYQDDQRVFYPAAGPEITTGEGSDVIYAGQGNDYVWAGIGNDLVFGDDGNDRLYGNSGDDTLLGGAGNDSIFGGIGGDYLDGGAGNDSLAGDEGDDILVGGVGNDTLKGGAGKDIYLFNKGDGIETIDDTPDTVKSSDASVVVLGKGLERKDVKFRKGSLWVDFGAADPSDPESSRDGIHFEGFDYLNPEATHVIGELRFFDGEVMTYSDILAQGFDIDGTDGDDDGHDAAHPQLVGTGVVDRIHGYGGNDTLAGLGGNDALFGDAGNDQLQGGDGSDQLVGGDGDDVLFGDAGNDVLNGGAGADYLNGGAGDDTYADVDAADRVVDTEGQNSIRFAAGISVDDIGITNVTDNGVPSLVLDIGGRDFLTIGRDPPGSFTNYQFADGTQFSHDELLGQRLFQRRMVYGTNEDDALHGYAGDDTIYSQGGNDQLFGYLGNDTLNGDDGNDTLVGGKGDDVLSGRRGNDTYLFSRGDGHDLIVDDGGAAGENVIRFAGDIRQEHVTFSRLANGDLLIVLDNGADHLTVRGWYTDPANRIERIEFGDGAFVTSAAFDSLAVAPIEGTNLADELAGTEYNDTILAYDGDDVSDGGAGDDHLEGGEGLDTYVLKYGMGRDTVIDSSAGGSAIQLAGGVRFADVDAHRNGNDLFVHISGTEQGMVLKDYYTNPQSWRVQNDAGEQQGVEQIVAATQAAEQDKVAMLRRAYLAEIRYAAISYYLGQGYQLQQDGTLFKSWSSGYSGDTAFGAVSETTDTTTTTLQWFPEYHGGATSTMTTTQQENDWDSFPKQLFSYTVVFNNRITHTDDASVYRRPSYYLTRTSEAVVLEAQWTSLDWNPSTRRTSATGGWIYEQTANGLTAVGTNTVESTRLTRTGNARGRIVNVMAGGSVPVSSGYYPRYLAATLVSETDGPIVEEVSTGASDNYIVGDGYDNSLSHVQGTSLVVDAGAGNDIVIGAQFAFGGAGDDDLRDGAVLIGGEGNDTLRGGAVLFGGAGNDYMDGTQFWASTRYLIDPNQFGNDVIEDSGDFGDEGGNIFWDVIEFDAGLAPDDLIVRWGPEDAEHRYVFLSWGQGKSIKAEIPTQRPMSDIEGVGHGIELIKFQDGTVWNVAELERRATLAATENDDTLYGGRFDDVIHGLGGNDTIYGQYGNDTLDGGAGDDHLFGGGGDDQYVFGPGSGHDYVHDEKLWNDSVWGEWHSSINTVRMTEGVSPLDVIVTRDEFDLHLVLGGGLDKLTLVGWFADSEQSDKQVVFSDGTVWDAAALEALISYAPTQGPDYLEGTAANDTLAGLGGDDILVAGGGDDTLEGSAGDDRLSGGAGNDTYVFRRGDGIDTIVDFSAGAGSTNSIRFDASVAVADVTAATDRNDLVLSIDGTGDRLILKDWFASGGHSVNRVEFADGTVWDETDLLAAIPVEVTDGDDFLRGGAGNDTLDGLAGNDILQGGAGDDVLSGGAGDDVYLYSRGDGSDVIEGDNAAAGNGDTLRFDATIGASDVTLTRDLSHLYVTITGTSDRITLRNWFAGDANKIERIEFADGTVWNSADLLANISLIPTEGDDILVGSQGPDVISGLGGNDDLYGGSGGDDILHGDAGDDALFGESGNDSLYGGTGDDTLDGGRGYDLLDGGVGNDVYLVSAGAGQDSIHDYDTSPGNTDTVRFDSTISPSDVTVTRDANNLFLSTTSGQERITVHDWFAGDAYKVERVEFANGTVWAVSDLEAKALFTVRGTDGVDYLEGEAEATLILGLDGNDELQGQEGGDTLDGGAGNDVLWGGGGNDTLNGGSGDDVLEGGTGDDTYLFGRGAGQDAIDDYDETVGNVDTVLFDATVSAADIVVSRDARNLYLSIGGTTDRLTIDEWFGDDFSKVEQVKFADGTVWDAADLISQLPRAPTEGDDYLDGSAGADVLQALAGNDYLFGKAGDDVLSGGGGSDEIYGGAGVDLLFGGAGDDFVQDWEGSNALDGGDGDDDLYAAGSSNFVTGAAGNDYLESWGPNSVVAFNAGDGSDTVYVGNALTLSLGGGISPHDLSLSVDGADIVLSLGGDDRIRLSQGAAAAERPAVTLQIIGSDIRTYDFSAVLAAFDAAVAQGTASVGWSMADVLASNLLTTSVDRAIGGILASTYAQDGSLAALAPDTVQDVLSDADFGGAAQLIEPDSASHVISGGPADDQLTGTDADETLAGGAGDDSLTGGLGDDTYLFNLGDGVDHIVDAGGTDIIEFGAGISPSSLSLGLGSLLVRVGTGADAVHIEGFDRGQALETPVIENFRFADGTTLTYEQLLARGFDLSGNGSISGTSVTDRVTGSGEDDTISGGAGDDTLSGGAGNDSYLFDQGDGVDTIQDAATPEQGNRIVFGAGITREDLRFEYGDGTLRLRYSDDDAIDLPNFSPFGADGPVVATIAFADGSTASLAELADRAPTAASALAAQNADEDSVFTHQIPADAFSDVDQGDALTFAAALADGSALPDWISFDSATRTFSGIPANGDVGTIAVRVTATDAVGKAADQVFELTVANTNDAPVVAEAIDKCAATQGQLFSFTVPISTFVDVDAGDTRSYSATLTNGEPLPAWLTLDGASGTFSGTPGNGDIGEVNIIVTATDGSRDLASTSFAIAVTNVNDAPILVSPMADQAAVEDMPFSYTLPSDAFKDIDVGDTLTYTATLGNGEPLPAWLSFDAATRTIAGTPGADQVGAVTVQIAATDAGGLSVADTFLVNVAVAADKILTGTSGADVLVGASGNDTLNGMGGNDSLFGNRGNDTITDSSGSDTIDGGAGDDVITDAGSGTNVLRGGDGNDTITFSHVANNTLEGGAGDDVLKVGSLAFGSRDYANTFAGGAGNDRIESGGSADTYLFNRGDGQDVIRDYDYDQGDKLDRVVFGAGIAASDVAVSRSGNHLVLKVKDPANPAAVDQVTIENWNISRWYRLEQVVFADGTTWSTAQLSALAVTGTGGNDSISGWWDPSVIDGKGGNDTIQSWNSNDTVYGGDGNDTITDTGGSDTIDGGAGDDVIDDIDSNGTNVLRGGDGNDTINFGNGRNTIEGGSGNDLIRQSSFYPSNNANTIAGGQGNDRMESGGSPDTYLFARGDGQDTIRDWDFRGMGGPDRLIFGAGIAAGDVAVSRSGNHLVLKVNDPANPAAADQITIEDWNTSSGLYLYRLEQVVFADGTTWSMAQLSSMAMTGTEAADIITIWSEGGYADGKGGNDSITGSSGSDTIDGGAGDDVITDAGSGTNALRGGDGNDTITFSYLANNTLEGGAGDDVLKVGSVAFGSRDYANTIAGGAGNDRMESGGSADTYLFNRGDGQDVIRDYDYDQGDKLDRVVFGAGIAAGDVAVSRSGNHLVLKVNDPANPAAVDQVTIENWNINRLYRLEQVVFADGTTWSTAQLSALAVTVTGTDGADTIGGWSVADIIYGLDGNDAITDLDGNDLLNGGRGNDTLDGGAGNDLFIGASGDDLIVTGAGADIIAFNRGDGQDVIAASAGKDNILSLGHGIEYVDLLFQRNNNDLTLQTGASEQLVFKDWYSSVNTRSVATLQMVIEGTADYDAASANQLNNKKVQQFNFDGLVAKFDSARGADPSLTNWSLSSSLLEFHLNGSGDTAALGGDLAYQYARNGNLSAISASPAQAILASTQFGTAIQNLQSSNALQDLTPRLM